MGKVVLPCKVHSTEHNPGSKSNQSAVIQTRLPIAHKGLHHCRWSDPQQGIQFCWSLYADACGTCGHHAAQHIHGIDDSGLVITTRACNQLPARIGV
jgi:hypothetical protein